MCIHCSLFRLLSIVLSSVVMMTCVRDVSAAMIAYDGFDYAAGTDNLAGKNGGTGWSDAWAASGGTSGLSEIRSPGDNLFPLITTGNKVFVEGSNQNAQDSCGGRAWNGATADSTVWISFIGQREASGPNSDNLARFFGASFYQGVVTTAGNERFSIGEGSNDTNHFWNARFTNTGIPAVDSTVPVTTESFLLVRIDYRSGDNDDLYLWVNPPLDGVEPDIGTADASNIDSFNLSFDRISLRAGTAQTTPVANPAAKAHYDEFRIGTTYQDVVPIPEPASIGLMLLSVVCATLFASRGRAAAIDFRH